MLPPRHTRPAAEAVWKLSNAGSAGRPVRPVRPRPAWRWRRRLFPVKSRPPLRASGGCRAMLPSAECRCRSSSPSPSPSPSRPSASSHVPALVNGANMAARHPAYPHRLPRSTELALPCILSRRACRAQSPRPVAREYPMPDTCPPETCRGCVNPTERHVATAPMRPIP